MNISELTMYSEKDLGDIDELMHELSAKSGCSIQKLKAVIEDGDSHLYVVRDADRIVGSACLCVAHSTEYTLGFIESVVVLSEYRGRHIGRKLMEHVLCEARRFRIDCLHLTSNKKRVVANSLYRKLGFELYDTNVYKMSLGIDVC